MRAGLHGPLHREEARAGLADSASWTSNRKWQAWFPQGKQELTSPSKPLLLAVGEPQLTAVPSGATGKDGFLAVGRKKTQLLLGSQGDSPCHGCPFFPGQPHVGHTKACQLQIPGGLRCVRDRKGQEPGTGNTSYSWRNLTVPEKKAQPSWFTLALVSLTWTPWF